jgi:DNA-binding PadR family transcriptional regulator
MPRRNPTDEVDSFLPLPNAVFHILVALADRDRHGYSIMQDVDARTGGKVRLSAGTLYTAIRRMLEQGLIEELRDSPDPGSADERRRYYRVTRLGRDVAVAEAKRFSELLDQARATRLIPRRL